VRGANGGIDPVRASASGRDLAEFQIVVRDYGSLIDALRAAKEHRQLAYLTIDAVAGLATSHSEKLLNGTKRIGPVVFGLILEALGVELVLRENPEAAKRLEKCERRCSNQAHPNRTVSQAVINRCRPIILSEMARKGWATRRAKNGNGHAANGHGSG
jgi:hypothetical protein